jgi:hypothetical protein
LNRLYNGCNRGKKNKHRLLKGKLIIFMNQKKTTTT